MTNAHRPNGDRVAVQLVPSGSSLCCQTHHPTLVQRLRGRADAVEHSIWDATSEREARSLERFHDQLVERAGQAHDDLLRAIEASPTVRARVSAYNQLPLTCRAFEGSLATDDPYGVQ